MDSKFTNEMDFKFQEFTRIIEATLADLNSEGANNGQNALSTIIFLRSILDKKLSTDFVKHMNGCNFTVNIPKVIESIYLYPESKISTANVVIKPPALLERAKLLFESKIFIPMISNTSVHFTTIDGVNLIPELFSIFKPENYTHYPKSAGLTLTDIDVSKIGKDKISNYLLETRPMFRLSSSCIKVRKINESCSYSEVMYIKIISDELLAWGNALHKHFNISVVVKDILFAFAVKLRRLPL